MPFIVDTAKAQINSVVFKWGGQQIEVKYNAGEKYRKLEKRIGDDLIEDAKKAIRRRGEGESFTPSEDDFRTVDQQIFEICEQLCMVMEEWDVEDGKGPVPLKPKAMSELGLPLEFYQGLSNAIAEDYGSGGAATKKG